MTKEELMATAFAEGEKSNEPVKCACVIAKDGEIIAAAYNSQRNDFDASAHDGIKAVALAGKKLGDKNLVGCEAYCSVEPCTMCLSAFVFAKIEKVYYVTPLEEISWENRIKISGQELLDKSPRKVELIKLTGNF